MKKNVPVFIIQVTGLLFLAPCVSAESSDPCGCNASLVDGIFSFRAEKGDDEAKSDVLRSVTQSSYEEMQKSFSAGGGASYAGFGLNANMSRGEFQKKIEELRKMFHVSGATKSTRDLLSRYGDSNVLNAWSKCKAECNPTGVWSYIERQDDQYFVFHVRWRPDKTEPNPKVIRSVLKGAKPVDETIPSNEILPKDTEIGPEEQLVYLVREQTNQPIIVSVNLKGSNRDVADYWPAVVPPPPTPTPTPPPPPCVGDDQKPSYHVRYFRPDADGLYTITATGSATNGKNNPLISLKIIVNGLLKKKEDKHWINNDFSWAAKVDVQLSKDTCYEIKATQKDTNADPVDTMLGIEMASD